MEKLLKRIQELFGGLDRVHGTYVVDEDLSEGQDKQEGHGKTIALPPTEDLWKKHLNGERMLGIVPIRDDGTVSWACIDIDSYNVDVCTAAVTFVVEYSLPFVICRSKSGGAHVLVFFKDPIPAKNVRKKLAGFAKAMGFEGSEVFPKQDTITPADFGSWLNMPYYDYEISSRYGLDPEGKRLTLEQFLDYADSKKITANEWAKLAIPDLEHPFSDGPPCLQTMARNKVSEGGRNNALLQFGVYAKFKFGDGECLDKTAEYNQKYIVPPMAQRELNDTVFKSLERRDYGYVCTQPPQAAFCNRTTCLRRRFGIGGAADEEFEQEMEMHNLRRLVQYTPLGEPLDDDPEWELTVQGRTLRFSTAELRSQSQFAERCMSKLKRWPPALPAPRWRDMIRGFLDNCEDVEIPFETSPPAQTLEALKDYIKQNAHAKNNLDLLNGLALKKEGSYRFRIESLVEFMRDKTRTIINPKLIAEHLELLGLVREKTSARQGADHVSIICYEIGVAQLEIFEQTNFAKPPDTSEF